MMCSHCDTCSGNRQEGRGIATTNGRRRQTPEDRRPDGIQAWRSRLRAGTPRPVIQYRMVRGFRQAPDLRFIPLGRDIRVSRAQECARATLARERPLPAHGAAFQHLPEALNAASVSRGWRNIYTIGLFQAGSTTLLLPMLSRRKIFMFSTIAVLLLLLAGAAATAAAWFYLNPRLPPIDALKEVKLQTPLRVYSADGRLLAEYGEQRRIALHYDEIPPTMIKAVLAAEDDRFFEHNGVDIKGILRAAITLLRTGEKSQGGSTITMQVARNFFLGREKTYLRKINEILLALKIEKELSKQQILELYLNKIYFGNRAYGVGAAARAYYGKDLNELSVAQMAMIAGLPKAPSIYNPIANPQRALARRNYALERMHALGSIDDITYRKALAEQDTARRHKTQPEVEAPYLGEMVRREMVKRYGKTAYNAGYRVFTTIDSRLQAAANRAVRRGLLSYLHRHGYPGPERHFDLPATELERWLRNRRSNAAAALPEELAGAMRKVQQLPVLGGLSPALVLRVDNSGITAWIAADDRLITLPHTSIAWALQTAGERGKAPRRPGDIFTAGDLIRVQPSNQGKWELAGLPQTEAALVSLDPHDGAILALTGGFDYFKSKFNRAIQAERQPGSSFKPFIYSAALEKGYTAASIINDAPVVMDDENLDETWKPQNYSGNFYGPTRLRVALTKSRNLVSIRLLRSIGVGYAAKYATRFGFRSDHLPRDLSLALGSGSVTPLELATGYAVFANGGYLISPYFIQRIEDGQGSILWEAHPRRACNECDNPRRDEAKEESRSEPTAKRVITPQNSFLMTSMMRDVVRFGTGHRAMELKRNDLAGKTGTTNDQFDAWFSGYNHAIVTTVWTGFDTPRPMGNRETGGRAALPIWIDFMRVALEGVPELPLKQPPGMVTVRIDPDNGLLANASTPKTIFETFRSGHVPDPRPETYWESSEENSKGLSELF